jgi:Uma2 family endonuclease
MPGEGQMTVQLARRLFTVDEYYRMAEAGIFQEDDRVELIEGEIVEMVPIGSHHAGVVKRLIALLSALISGDQAILAVQDPVRLSEFSEPEPDVALLRPRRDFYAEGHPGPLDVLLIIEVADSSAEADRDIKAPLYARAGVVEVWVIDVNGGVLDVYRHPSAGSYAVHLTAARGDIVSPESLPDVKLTVSEILG